MKKTLLKASLIAMLGVAFSNDFMNVNATEAEERVRAVDKESANRELINAAKAGNLDAVKWLLTDCGADVNFADENGRTPLRLACESGDLDMVNYLIEDHKVKIPDGFSEWSTTDTLLNYLRKNQSIQYRRLEETYKAAEKGDDQALRELMFYVPFAIEEKDRYSETLLSVACQNKNISVVKYLIEECKADPNMQNKDGSTALHIASRDGHLDIVKYLIEECKADPNIKNKDGDTPLHYASEKGHLDIVKYLVEEHGADKNIEDTWQSLVKKVKSSDVQSYLKEVFTAPGVDEGYLNEPYVQFGEKVKK